MMRLGGSTLTRPLIHNVHRSRVAVNSTTRTIYGISTTIHNNLAPHNFIKLVSVGTEIDPISSRQNNNLDNNHHHHHHHVSYAAATVARRYFHSPTINSRDEEPKLNTTSKWLLSPKRFFSFSSSPLAGSSSSSSSSTNTSRPRRKRRAPVNLTTKTRNLLRILLSDENVPNDKVIGVILKYQQSSTGEPRMVFTFDFVEQGQLGKWDEEVPLLPEEEEEEEETSSSASPEDDEKEVKRKLYVHETAFMKVLGATIDIGDDGLTPILYDKEGNVMDPNI